MGLLPIHHFINNDFLYLEILVLIVFQKLNQSRIITTYRTIYFLDVNSNCFTSETGMARVVSFSV
jgi:hypothetical protein